MSKGKSGQLRIIGGEYRGRKLVFPDVPGLRPTPDRVRETLFNWLMPVIQGARCLDLFAGSGALGLEALSRGASRVVLVDEHAGVIKQLRDNKQILRADNVHIVQADGLAYLNTEHGAFDIVFLDPPYRADLLPRCIKQLEDRGWLAGHAWIYLEAPATDTLPAVPETWQLYRSKKAGQVGYHLFQRIKAPE
ncbi:16S rRNA (guanine(966)-N(2))-methyltransferase RsmD [Kaarinaea lacus]